MLGFLACRLKKKELTAFAHSSKAIMNEAIKAAKEEIHNSKSAAAKSEPQEQVKVKPQQVERPKIIVSIQGKDVFKQFRVNKVNNSRQSNHLLVLFLI